MTAERKAILLSVGSEILRGETVDTNAAHLGGELNRLGFRVLTIRALPDDRAVIAAAVREARAAASLVLVTGGLGPTHDDLTRESIADAVDEPLVEDPELVEVLHERFRPMRGMAAINLRQALRVPSAIALPNPIGSAPGWWLDRDGGVVATMPGVPSEMRKMFAEQIQPRLTERFALAPLASRIVKTFGLGESTVAERLAGLLDGEQPYEAGIYAKDDGVHVHFASRTNPEAVDAAAARALELAGIDAYGSDDDNLPSVVLRAMAGRGAASVASIERGTGGALLAILSAARADAGAAYRGGVLADDDGASAPAADTTIILRLHDEDGHGRSRVGVELRGAPMVEPAQTRVHGSGPQRLRRAAFAALDHIRRALTA